MQITRIEINGKARHRTVERKAGSDQIRIDSIVRNPKRGQEAWKIWELPGTVSDEELFEVAMKVQSRTDGYVGTNSDVHGYFGEMRRFQD